MKKVLKVEGMMCEHCKATVEKALMAVDGVSEAAADLDQKTAVVICDDEVTSEALIKAVTDADYTVTGID